MERQQQKSLIALLFLLMTGTFFAQTPQAMASPPLTDFNGDGYADLVVGATNEDVNGHPDAGLVNVIYGSNGGLSAATALPDQRFFQDYSAGTLASNIRDFSEANDSFGAAVTTGDFNNDGYSDLAIGVPGEDLGSTADAGAVNVIYGSPTGLSPSSVLDDQLWTGSSPGISDGLPPTCPIPISGIGKPGALATGDFNGDSHDDMAFGADTFFPGEGGAGPCGHAFYGASGMLFVVYGSPSGLAITAARPDQVGRVDSIGDYARTVSAGDFNNDGKDDLVASFAMSSAVAPGDLTGGGLGAVYVYHGSAAGLPESPFPSSAGLLGATQQWSQGGPDDDIEDSGETQDRFGFAVAADDFNGDAYADMAAGVPAEDLNSDLSEDQGAVNVIYGSPTGLSATSALADQFWTQDSAGIEDSGEAGDRFGSALG